MINCHLLCHCCTTPCRLLCHCQAGLACHAEILAALANEPRATEAALHALCEQCAVETDGDRH